MIGVMLNVNWLLGLAATLATLTVDFPSAPMSISDSPGGGYRVTNRTTVDIVSFRLACVQRKPQLRITRLFDTHAEKVVPGESLEVFAKHGPPEKAEKCALLDSALAVYQVQTADGGVWYQGVALCDRCKTEQAGGTKLF